MRTIEASEAFKDWRKLAHDTRSAPIRVVGEAEGAMVVMSEGEYARLRGLAWDNLFTAMDRLAVEAEASGLTEEKLDELLADES
jgi:hypothetical protein